MFFPPLCSFFFHVHPCFFHPHTLFNFVTKHWSCLADSTTLSVNSKCLTSHSLFPARASLHEPHTTPSNMNIFIEQAQTLHNHASSHCSTREYLHFQTSRHMCSFIENFSHTKLFLLLHITMASQFTVICFYSSKFIYTKDLPV